MMFLNRFHGDYVHGRRVRVLSEQLASLLPRGGTVLDVGAGDGRLAELIQRRRPDVRVRGLDVMVRPDSAIPVERFDGRVIPSGDATYDAVLFVDVLHHTEDPTVLLREARRVSRSAVVIKDHTRDGLLAGPTLRFMDWVGNAKHGVALPYNYWPLRRWRQVISDLGLRVGFWKKDLGLYPAPADWVFGRSLHFVARLEVERASPGERRPGGGEVEAQTCPGGAPAPVEGTAE